MSDAPSRAQVMHGKGLTTAGGLSKKDLKVGNDGEIKSKAASKAAKKVAAKPGSWIDCLEKARDKLKLKNKFVLITKDSELYKEAMKIKEKAAKKKAAKK